MKLRPKVRAFAQAMERELRANDWKGGWEEMDKHEIISRLYEEMQELREEVLRPQASIIDAQVLKESVDVANFAMFMADIFGTLPTTPDDAAPDLLAALELAESALAIQASYRYPDQARIQKALESTRTAIAKAKGVA
jgi:NTP pyrophosphatase (non-canonical NTP hydrolase)